jgi:hypothetical protein
MLRLRTPDSVAPSVSANPHHPAAVGVIVAVALVCALIAADVATAATRTLSPTHRHGRTLVFKLRGVEPSQIRGAYLKAQRFRFVLNAASVRAAARRGTLRVRMPRTFAVRLDRGRSARSPRTTSPTLVLVTSTATTAGGSTSTSTGTATATFAPIADAYVNATKKTHNYGTTADLRADASPVLRSYLRFDVQGLTAPVSRAYLKLHATGGSSVPLDVRPTSASWLENAITFANAPAVGAVAASSDAFGSGSLVSIDVASLVKGNGAMGLALTSSSGAGVVLSSREAGANAPQLQIETGTAFSPLPSPPSVPTSLMATATQTSISLSWTGSTDDVGVAGYGLYLDDAPVGTTTSTSFGFSGLVCGTSYTLSVDAYDAAGNRSAMASLGAATLDCSSSGLSTYQIPANIANDCSVDVTQAILSWIASVPDYSILSFGRGACYRIDGTLQFWGRNGLDFEGNGSTFRAGTTGDASRSQWRVVDGSDFVFRNMTVRGANTVSGFHDTTLQHQHAFDLLGASGVEIDHANASDLYGDCVYIGLGWVGTVKSWSSNIDVHDMTCTRNGRMGVAVTAGRDVVVERSSFSEIALSVFVIEPNGAGFGARNITFTNNKIGTVYDYAFVAAGDGPVDGVTVTNNTLSGAAMHMAVLPPPGQRRSNITITGNQSDAGFYNTNGAAMDFARVDGLTVKQNTALLSAPNMALASVTASCAVDISGNSYAIGVVEARISAYSCPAG